MPEGTPAHRTAQLARRAGSGRPPSRRTPLGRPARGCGPAPGRRQPDRRDAAAAPRRLDRPGTLAQPATQHRRGRVQAAGRGTKGHQRDGLPAGLARRGRRNARGPWPDLRRRPVEPGAAASGRTLAPGPRAARRGGRCRGGKPARVRRCLRRAVGPLVRLPGDRAGTAAGSAHSRPHPRRARPPGASRLLRRRGSSRSARPGKTSACTCACPPGSGIPSGMSRTT